MALAQCDARTSIFWSHNWLFPLETPPCPLGPAPEGRPGARGSRARPPPVLPPSGGRSSLRVYREPYHRTGFIPFPQIIRQGSDVHMEERTGQETSKPKAFHREGSGAPATGHRRFSEGFRQEAGPAAPARAHLGPRSPSSVHYQAESCQPSEARAVASTQSRAQCGEAEAHSPSPPQRSLNSPGCPTRCCERRARKKLSKTGLTQHLGKQFGNF